MRLAAALQIAVWVIVGLPCVVIALLCTPCLRRKPKRPPPGSMAGRVAVVTGANTGIGLQTAKQLASAGATVILACRDVSKARLAASALEHESAAPVEVVPMLLDLSDLKSVFTFASEFKRRFDRLDVLVCNAGLNVSTPRTAQGHEASFGVGYLGHAFLVMRLLPLLEGTAGARVVALSSVMHWFAVADSGWDNALAGVGPDSSYGAAKLALIYMAVALRSRGVHATAVNPGAVSGPLHAAVPRGGHTGGFIAAALRVAPTRPALPSSPRPPTRARRPPLAPRPASSQGPTFPCTSSPGVERHLEARAEAARRATRGGRLPRIPLDVRRRDDLRGRRHLAATPCSPLPAAVRRVLLAAAARARRPTRRRGAGALRPRAA